MKLSPASQRDSLHVLAADSVTKKTSSYMSSLLTATVWGRGCHLAELWILLLIFPSLTLPGVPFSLSPLCPSFFCIWLLEGQLGQRHRTDPNAIRHGRMFTGSMQTSADLGILEVLETEAWLYLSSRFTNCAIVSILHWCHKSALHPCAAELLCLLTHRTTGAVAPVGIVATLQARWRVSSLWS